MRLIVEAKGSDCHRCAKCIEQLIRWMLSVEKTGQCIWATIKWSQQKTFYAQLIKDTDWVKQCWCKTKNSLIGRRAWTDGLSKSLAYATT
jgi:hypothetical protein